MTGNGVRVPKEPVTIKDEEKTNITFELKNPTEIKIMRKGVQIGQIYSQDQTDGMTPYPHNKNSYCLNSIQICGFDKIKGPWACGPYAGHKDTVVYFRPTDDGFFTQKKEQYHKYVKSFISDEKNDPSELLSFTDWIETIGCF